MPCSAWHHGRHHPEAGGPSASCSCTLLTLLHPFSFRPSLYGAESAPSSDPQIGALTTEPFSPPGAQHSAMHCTLSAQVCYTLRYTVCACAVFPSAPLRSPPLPSAALRSALLRRGARPRRCLEARGAPRSPSATPSSTRTRCSAAHAETAFTPCMHARSHARVVAHLSACGSGVARGPPPCSAESADICSF